MNTVVKTILSKTTGFIAAAGFTHSLSPARNCTFGCTYCYVPTMGIYGGLKPDDWKRWGQFTTFKSNAPDLLARELRPGQSIYCSPLVDPYQPAETEECMMPRILKALLTRPPSVFVVQTRGPLILRDLETLLALSRKCTVRISFSLTTDRDDVRKLYEPHCAPFEARLRTMQALRNAGLEVRAALAPLLPCNPESMTEAAIASSTGDLIGDPFHVRSKKPRGATTRGAALKISTLHGFSEWHDPEFQAEVVERIERVANAAGRRFGIGEEGFSWLSKAS
jgi:DNA repair photolyase